MTLEEAR